MNFMKGLYMCVFWNVNFFEISNMVNIKIFGFSLQVSAFVLGL